MTGYVFDVLGIPQQKGSSRIVPVKGRMVVVSDNRKLRPWEVLVRAAATIAKRTQNHGELVLAPVTMAMEFRMPVPKRRERWHAGYHCLQPDLDKLVRGVCDPLSGVLYHDDRHIARLSATKRYVRGAESPGVRIALTPLLAEE